MGLDVTVDVGGFVTATGAEDGVVVGATVGGVVVGETVIGGSVGPLEHPAVI